jgi:CHAT domain-containing protein/Tfp pilus assembly protein PilF
MYTRSIAVPAAVLSTALLLTASVAPVNPRLRAQQPISSAGTSSGPSLPPDVQARLDKLQADLKTAHDQGDAKGEATALNAIGNLYAGVSAYQQALEEYNQALPIRRAAGDRAGEAATLSNIGYCYTALGEKQKALEYYNQALPIQRQVDDHDGEATTLNNIAAVYSALGEKQKALDYFNEALLILRQMGDRGSEAATLSNVGAVYSALGEKQKALEYYNQALPIQRQVGDRGGEARTLDNIAAVYSALGEKQKALDYFNEALPILPQIGDLAGEAVTLNNIATVYDDLGEKQKALEYFNHALQVCREIGDRVGEAVTLNNIGRIYDALGEKQKALDYYGQALPIQRQVGDRDGEARTLDNIAAVYSALGEKQKALDLYNQVLPILRQVGDRPGEATTLNNIGRVYSDLGEKQKALDYYNHALPIIPSVGDRVSEAVTLSNIGMVYDDVGEKQKALDYFSQALPIASAVNDPLLESVVFGNLMHVQRDQQPTLAIFYGKQAVNLLQQVRGNIQGLSKELQRTFVTSKSNYYRDLADLLIGQGRLPEAQQVMDLLKEQEYSDFVRGENTRPAAPLSLTPAEQQAEEDYQKTTAQLVAQGQRWSDLKKNKARTQEEEKEFQQLTSAVNNARTGLQGYYDRLYTLFGGKNSDANEHLVHVTDNVSQFQQAIAEMPHTVALRTVVSQEGYSVIVVTGTAPPVARSYAVSEQELNHKIAAFQQVLRDPRQDPRPLAQELYKIVVGPVQADLDQAQAQTIVWSLDGVLRYIPMSALFDGRQYLVEKYNSVIVTPASVLYLREQPAMQHPSVLAMGISRKYEDNLNPLPTVVSELKDIVSDPQVSGANGVLPGSILLNGQFTEKAMEDRFSEQPNVVHIASHFVLQPGNDEQSYLLLAGKDQAGAGYHLTVAEFRDNQNLDLQGTDLLTLSACETGMGSIKTGNGEEVDGLGEVAQKDKRARAVISSLWEVNDASTGALMADFYKRWADGRGKVMKVEALRQAQLDLLEGRVTPKSSTSGRGFTVGGDEPAAQPGSIGYAHPYYWAPFVLTGNWR